MNSVLIASTRIYWYLKYTFKKVTWFNETEHFHLGNSDCINMFLDDLISPFVISMIQYFGYFAVDIFPLALYLALPSPL